MPADKEARIEWTEQERQDRDRRRTAGERRVRHAPSRDASDLFGPSGAPGISRRSEQRPDTPDRCGFDYLRISSGQPARMPVLIDSFFIVNLRGSLAKRQDTSPASKGNHIGQEAVAGRELQS